MVHKVQSSKHDEAASNLFRTTNDFLEFGNWTSAFSLSLTVVNMSIYSWHSFSFSCFYFLIFILLPSFPIFPFFTSSFSLSLLFLLRLMSATRHAFKQHMRWHKRDRGRDSTSKAIMKQFIICDLDVYLNLYLLSRIRISLEKFWLSTFLFNIWVHIECGSI